MGKHFYEDDGNPQCQQRCVVGELGRARRCICELISGHDGPCERIWCWRLASVNDYERWPAFKNFISAN
jgi:hypothetical protein